jgi:hypothetical protein
MSDYEYRNKTFDYTAPSRTGSAGGLLFVVALIMLFFVGMVIFGASGGDTTAPVATDGAQSGDSAPAVTAPAIDSTPVVPAPADP